MSQITERFLRYCKINTQSDESSTSVPTTPMQHDLAKLLVGELSEMGAEEITYDTEHCYVYATIPATVEEERPVLGLIAHMDTSPAMSGKNVKPRILSSYDGEDIMLNEEKNIVMKVSQFPELTELVGKTLIVTDGTTLLGADDKAGIAIIMTVAEYLLTHKECRHGKIRIGFTPDEEVGRGTDHFDVELFGADYAYTIDGGALGELEYENFNAAGARVIFQGRSVHPGSAKNKMRNALLLAMEFQAMLPVFENPMYTEGYEGFFHLDWLEGGVETATADYIIRDHDRDKFEEKKAVFLKAAEYLCAKYGPETVRVEMKDSYYNMREILKDHMFLVENARSIVEEMGILPRIVPIRGGTDGARLSFMGLPCPNLFTGGGNFHGKYEYACVEGMEQCVELLLKLAAK